MKISKQGDEIVLDGSHSLLLTQGDYALEITVPVENLVIQNWNIHCRPRNLQEKLNTTWAAFKFIWGKAK